jgi:uncharacterized zinc-type alcohol dehydrogenase-like protein
MKRKSYPIGSLIGGIAETQEMLDYCAEQQHCKRSRSNTRMPTRLTTAYERMLKGDVRYRFVIDTASLR